LFFKDGPNPRDWWGELIRSNDNGKTIKHVVVDPSKIKGKSFVEGNWPGM
jgi:hypothetical protein